MSDLSNKSRRLPLPHSLQRLARAIFIDEGFALYIVFCTKQTVAKSALAGLSNEIERLKGSEAQVVTIHVAPSDVGSPAPKHPGAIDELFRTETIRAHYIVIDASGCLQNDTPVLRFFFERLNERRNQLMELRKLPILLVLPKFAERLLVQVAPDLWSIRSLPAMVLKEKRKRQPPSTLAAAPPLVAFRSAPLTIALLYAAQDQNFALDIERHLRAWTLEGLIRFVHVGTALKRSNDWTGNTSSPSSADLIVVLDSPELFRGHKSHVWLREAWVSMRPLISIVMRSGPRQLYLPNHWRTLPHDGMPLSLLRQNERDEVMLELTQEVRKLAERVRPLGTSRNGGSVSIEKNYRGVDEWQWTLTMGKIRFILDRTLPTYADFDAFCIDYFPDVARRFTGNMTRTARINLLLAVESAESILLALESSNRRR